MLSAVEEEGVATGAGHNHRGKGMSNHKWRGKELATEPGKGKDGR